MASAAIFWDRDNTLIKDPGYLNDPDQVELLPGAAEAVRQLAAAGFQQIIATNQSGVARGLMDEATVEKIHQRLRERFAAAGARFDAIYYCPYLDGKEATVEAYRRDSDTRKPKPGMLVQASMERTIDLAGSWSIGDSIRDAEAGRAAGCRTILIANHAHANPPQADQHGTRAVDFVAGSLGEAVNIVLKQTREKTDDDMKDHREAASGGMTGRQEGGDSVAILQDILSFLKQMDRRARAEDFSLAKLAGAVVQLVAVGALIWAVFGMSEEYGVQFVRLSYAMVFQLIALTLFVVGKK